MMPSANKKPKVDTAAAVDIDEKTTTKTITPTSNEGDKSKPTILTFTAAHDRFARLQLLSTHIYLLFAGTHLWDMKDRKAPTIIFGILHITDRNMNRQISNVNHHFELIKLDC